MGFKVKKVKYYIVKEAYADDDCTLECPKNCHRYELTPGQVLDLTYGILDFGMVEKLVSWLKEN